MFEIVFKSGKSLFISADKRADVTTKAIELGKMSKFDCYDIQEILEVNPSFAKHSAVEKSEPVTWKKIDFLTLTW